MIVVDASALYKLIIREEHSEFVENVLLKETSIGEPIIIPDVAVSEILNVLWVDYIKKKSIDSRTFNLAITNFDRIIENLDIISAKSLKEIAVKLATSKKITIYDSMYLSASLFRGAPLLSFDSKMQKAASETGVSILYANAK